MGLKSLVRDNCSPATYRRWKRVAKTALGWWYRDDLNRLASLYRTDKWGCHWYTQHYQRYFSPLRLRRLNLLEIGVGGYQDADEGGASLRMWKAYFRRSQIVGIDLYDKRHFSEHRIDVRQCDQTDAEGLTRLSEQYGGFDIIIDDGSHISEHIIQTFHVLFPLLRANGIYAVEDLQTSYWPTWGGGMNKAQTSMSFFKGLIDGLNHVEFPQADYTPSYFDQNIVEMAFFHNLVIIRKGANDEQSNAGELIQQEIEELKAVRSPVSAL